MEKEEPMSSTPGRKPKAESYAYSWFLPADGHNGSAIVSQVPPSELEATAEAENHEISAMEARTEQWRHSGKRQTVPHQGRTPNVTDTRARVIGMLGWSAVAGSGAVVLLTRAGQFPSTQVGILAGVWLGVSAAIWFIPALLSRGKAAKA
jgi:hypothetical protein